MTQRCPSCGLSQQRIRTPDGGEDWLCRRCDGTDVTDAIATVRDEIGLDKRNETDAEICALAFGLAETARDTFIGRGPHTRAAAYIYLGSIIAGEKINQPELADAAGISTTALRNCYLDLYEISGFADHYGEIEAGELNPSTANPAIDVDGWRKYLEGKNATHGAVKTGASNVRRFAKWYDGDGEPTAEDIEGWLAHLADEGYAPSTIESRWGDISSYFEWAGLGELTDDDVNLDEHVVRAYRLKA